MTDGGQSQQVIALVHPGPLSSVISVALVIIHSVNIICTNVPLYYLMLHYFFRLERNFAPDETLKLAAFVYIFPKSGTFC